MEVLIREKMIRAGNRAESFRKRFLGEKGDSRKHGTQTHVLNSHVLRNIYESLENFKTNFETHFKFKPNFDRPKEN